MMVVVILPTFWENILNFDVVSMNKISHAYSDGTVERKYNRFKTSFLMAC
jgi:hypothetical protein